MTSGNMSTDKMTNDGWLHALRTDPSPLFKAQLRERLRAQEPVSETRHDWPRRALVAAAAVILVGVLLSVPGVRASVAQFVSLFRVINLVGVPVDSSHIDRLKAEQLDIGSAIRLTSRISPPAPSRKPGARATAIAATLPVSPPGC